VLDEGDKGTDVAEVIVKVNRIIDAVKSTVPQEMWGEISEKLEELEHPDALDVGTDSFDEADDEPFDPDELDDFDDELDA
jgi:hypothetical protein